MGYITNNAAGGVVRIPHFIGLWQDGDGFSGDPRYAVECHNAQTRGGYLRPMAKCEALPWELPAPIQTLKLLHRRWYTPDEHHDILVAACNGRLYWAYPEEGGWHQMSMPEGWQGSTYESDVWSAVTYEINPTAEADPVDVLLMSNDKDGMICIRGDTMEVSTIATPRKFGVIARFNDRIFGGAIPDSPDTLVYSAPYDPYDWAANEDDPAMGAGDIQQPSWDGDSFTALVPFGDYLLCVKKYRIWRLAGSDPTEYTFYEQYGGGCRYPQTIAVSPRLGVLMMGGEGLQRYNGETTDDYMEEYARKVFYAAYTGRAEEAFGVLFRDRYYLALPRAGSQYNDAVLVFNPKEGSWLYRTGVSVESFLATDSKLYFTSHETPGIVYLWRDDAWQDGEAEEMEWVSPWLDFGFKNRSKSAFTVYVTVECESEVALQISMETEKKIKTKTVSFSPPVNGGESRQRRIGFGGNGRRIRLRIASEAGQKWRIIGGIQLEAETDAD